MRGWLYDRLLMGLTPAWYRAVLERLPRGARLLDIGIGTAGALVRNADRVRELDLRVVGVDIDADYLARAHQLVEEAGLAERVVLVEQSIHDFRDERPFDAAYFSGSFMLIPEPAEALRHVASMLAPDGRLYFTQTFQTRRSPLTERIKPALRRLTTVDFGSVTYEEAFLETLGAAGVAVLEQEELGRRGASSFRLVVGRA